jgi:hypothetical protein
VHVLKKKWKQGMLISTEKLGTVAMSGHPIRSITEANEVKGQSLHSFYSSVQSNKE